MTVFLGLGSNKGDRDKYIDEAIERISEINGVEVTKKAPVYETEPWGVKDQEFFLNTVIQIETTLPADTLHSELKRIERELGRGSGEKWSEREIDIDLLFYGEDTIITENMKIPHHQIENRRFVLVPLADIAPEYVHPVLKKSISMLLADTSDELQVSKYRENVQEEFGK